eukprot:COSAG02_NODE_131_length_34710_cov_17.171159_25_plen_378_part_00
MQSVSTRARKARQQLAASSSGSAGGRGSAARIARGELPRRFRYGLLDSLRAVRPFVYLGLMAGLEGWLGPGLHKAIGWYLENDLGAEEPDDLLNLQPEHLQEIKARLKPLQLPKFEKKYDTLKGARAAGQAPRMAEQPVRALAAPATVAQTKPSKGDAKKTKTKKRDASGVGGKGVSEAAKKSKKTKNSAVGADHKTFEELKAAEKGPTIFPVPENLIRKLFKAYQQRSDFTFTDAQIETMIQYMLRRNGCTFKNMKTNYRDKLFKAGALGKFDDVEELRELVKQLSVCREVERRKDLDRAGNGAKDPREDRFQTYCGYLLKPWDHKRCDPFDFGTIPPTASRAVPPVAPSTQPAINAATKREMEARACEGMSAHSC